MTVTWQYECNYLWHTTHRMSWTCFFLARKLPLTSYNDWHMPSITQSHADLGQPAWASQWVHSGSFLMHVITSSWVAGGRQSNWQSQGQWVLHGRHLGCTTINYTMYTQPVIDAVCFYCSSVHEKQWIAVISSILYLPSLISMCGIGIWILYTWIN